MVQAFTINATTFPAAKITSFAQIINVALPLALTGAGLIFLAMTLYAAFNILTHGDNPDALKKATTAITTAVIGLVIVIVSFLAVKLLKILP
jgi:FtsH-binding integral membrane protein